MTSARRVVLRALRVPALALLMLAVLLLLLAQAANQPARPRPVAGWQGIGARPVAPTPVASACIAGWTDQTGQTGWTGGPCR